jgi:hypothetical protein
MSREDQRESGEKIRGLLHGSLKLVRVMALVAAFVPLASVPVSRAVAQDPPICDPEGQIPCPPVCDPEGQIPCPPVCDPEGEIPCPATVPDPCDFVTGGGFVFTNLGARANFGSHGGCKHGAFWGHVNYVDHGGVPGKSPYHVRSIEITGYLMFPVDVAPPTARDICGFARTNANEPQPVRFRVRMEDNGEPGVLDRFGIRLSNGYHVSTRPLGDGGPGGGNIQLHKANPSSTAPASPGTEGDMCGGLATP